MPQVCQCAQQHTDGAVAPVCRDKVLAPHQLLLLALAVVVGDCHTDRVGLCCLVLSSEGIALSSCTQWRRVLLLLLLLVWEADKAHSVDQGVEVYAGVRACRQLLRPVQQQLRQPVLRQVGHGFRGHGRVARTAAPWEVVHLPQHLA